MKSERIIINNQEKKYITNKSNKKINIINTKKFKIIFFIVIILLIILASIALSLFFINNRNNNSYMKNMNITNLIQNDINFNDKICKFIKRKLKNRKQPFSYEEELSFFLSLIKCKIPFSFIRFGDGENLIMKGKKVKTGTDNWFWDNKNYEVRDKLIESVSICTNPNNFIAIPCKNWLRVSKSILSYSNCTTSKYMSYATVFINKNFQFFQNWIVKFINSSNRWKIILVANSLIKKDISWAYKFFPIPEKAVENWEKLSAFLLPKLEKEAKKNNLIFFVSAGPLANIIISHLIKINKKNIYIDFGSSIELITKGFSTRTYLKNRAHGLKRCESFYLENHIPFYTE